MQGFEPVTLSWRGASYTVAAEDQLRLIAEIEDALADRSGRPAVMALCARGGPSHSRLAAAYGAALRHAGATVTDAEIYLSIVDDLGRAEAATAIKVQNAILGLLAIMAPPIHRRIMAAEEAEDPAGKPAGETAAPPPAA
ncbi:hypothetical protein R5H32_16095 [Defluviimonas sp. D31]|uniref:hypothetical protein n=1 Tax=Defluviimonas sp. D31 TaxID=3083253 RepID=UPI00296F25CC|nr:hypothetical protein [Defluviimonas sp. D31]MDW4550884.1 hypothetical protein [Defluviimonas sp. D31]